MNRNKGREWAETYGDSKQHQSAAAVSNEKRLRANPRDGSEWKLTAVEESNKVVVAGRDKQ